MSEPEDKEQAELDRDIAESKKVGKGNPGGVLEEFIQRQDYLVKPPEKLPEDELRKFVLALCDGRVFTSAHIRNDNDLPIVFMPLALGMFRDHTQKEMQAILSQVGVFYEYLDQAGPTAINGCPTFFSVRMLHKDDWQRAHTAYDAEMKRRKDIPV